MPPSDSRPDPRTGRNPEVPSAEVSGIRGISLVWIIPIVAALIGGWLAYKTLSERGPLVTIAFKKAEGVQAGETKVKYKDVVIGEVVSVDLSPDLTDVLVSARLDKGTAPYLTTRTRFWVERPRVTLQGITGLGTLVTGVYIALDPSEAGDPTSSFDGLEQPPIVTHREEGRLFKLRAETLESLSVGSPVTLRQIRVGQVVGYELNPDHDGVTLHIFIRSPHDRQVKPNTRFWTTSGVEFRLTADGLDLDTDSLASLLFGAITFETPPSLEEAEPAPENTVFELFRSQEAVANREFVEKERYVLLFQGSVRGLSVDAPVEFRGIRIGRVTDVRLQFDVDAFRFNIPVMVEVEPGRIDLTDRRIAGGSGGGVISELVERGLRAQLKTGNLLTGQLFVDLDFHRDAAPVEVSKQGDFWVIPTVPTPLDALANRLKSFLAQVETWPIEQFGEDVGESLQALRELLESEDLRRSFAHLQTTLSNAEEAARRLNKSVVPEAGKVVDQAGDLVAKNSPLYRDLEKLIQELSSAARAVRNTADYLGRHPESLLRGK